MTFLVMDPMVVQGGRTYTANWNFGQKPFKFPPPDGFQPLSLSMPLNQRKSLHVLISMWAVLSIHGNNTVGREIDLGRNHLTWFGSRKEMLLENHILVDTVRGANNSLNV